MKGLWMFLIVPLSDVFTVYEFIELNTRPLVGKKTPGGAGTHTGHTRWRSADGCFAWTANSPPIAVRP